MDDCALRRVGFILFEDVGVNKRGRVDHFADNRELCVPRVRHKVGACGTANEEHEHWSK